MPERGWLQDAALQLPCSFHLPWVEMLQHSFELGPSRDRLWEAAWFKSWVSKVQPWLRIATELQSKQIGEQIRSTQSIYDVCHCPSIRQHTDSHTFIPVQDICVHLPVRLTGIQKGIRRRYKLRDICVDRYAEL